MARCGHAASGMGREGREMEACGTDSGASSCKEAQGPTMAVRGVRQGCKRSCSEGKTGWHRMLGTSLQRSWKSRQGPSVISWLRRVASCGAADAERDQPSLQRSLASRASGNRGLKNMRGAYACYRAAGIPRKTVFLDHRSCSQSKHG